MSKRISFEDDGSSEEHKNSSKPLKSEGRQHPIRGRRMPPDMNRMKDFDTFGNVISSLPWDRLGGFVNDFMQNGFKEIMNPDLIQKVATLMDKRGTMAMSDIVDDFMNSMPMPLKAMLANFNFPDDFSYVRKNFTIPPAIKTLICSEKP